MLWGFVGSTGMMTQIHTPVAVYDTLRAIVSEELAKQRLPVADTSALAIGIETKATIGIEIEATPAQSRTLLPTSALPFKIPSKYVLSQKCQALHYPFPPFWRAADD